MLMMDRVDRNDVAMQEKQLTITEWLTVAKEQIKKKNLAGAHQIYSGVLENVPDHNTARLGMLSVSDAVECDYYPLIETSSLERILVNIQNQNFEDCHPELTKLAAMHPQSALLASFLGFIARSTGHVENAIFHFEKAYELNPNEENTKNFLGLLIEKKDFDFAYAVCDSFLKHHPDSPEILLIMSIIQMQIRDYSLSEKTIKRALSLNAQSAHLWEQYGILKSKENSFQDAIPLFEKGLSLGLKTASLFQNLAVAHSKTGNQKNALTCFEKALQLDGSNPQIRHSYSLALLADEQYGLGWEQFEWRLTARDNVRFRHPCETKTWDGSETLKGKTMLVYYEQGFGDTIQFSRYIPELEKLGARVLFCVQDKLRDFFNSISFPSTLVDPDDTSLTPDFSLSLMSLPYALRNHHRMPLHQSSFMKRPDKQLSSLNTLPKNENKPLIGLCWRGNPSNRNDVNRSLSLERLLLLAKMNVTLVNLQIDLTEEEDALLKTNDITNPCHGLSTFSGTAAICEQLDAVVTVDTSICHLAGSLEIPTFLLLSKASDWRWGTAISKTPWYNKMKLFKQVTLGDWDEPLEALMREVGNDVITKRGLI